MWPTTLSNIFILPFLLISIPLALSASITATLALTTLFIRALVVYFELVIALLANFFLFPAHSPASGSFLALTEGSTPGVERTGPYGRAMKYGQKSRRGSLSSKEGVVEDYFFHHNHPQHGQIPIHPPHEALSSFISGNAERDFEGVGGWRTPLPRKIHHQTSSASSMSYNNSSEDELLLDNDDDEAWLSINKRLELPSRRFHVASPMLSPKLATTVAVEDQTRHHHQHHQAHQQEQQQQQQKPQRPKFHRRSKTSPPLSTQKPSSTTATTSQQPPRDAQQLQTSKSSASLDSLSSPPRPSSSTQTPSSSSGWHDISSPLFMTSSFSGLGADYKMVHYYSHHQPFAGRGARRRSSGGSSSAATAAKPMSLTGLGLT